jgi:hypothetical protein
MGGICAAQTLMWTKTSLDIVLDGLKHVLPPKTAATSSAPLVVGVTLALAFAAFIQLYCLNRAMHYELPVLVIPVFYALFASLSFVNTLVLQHTYPFSWSESAGIAVGMSLILLGVRMLSTAHMEPGQALASSPGTGSLRGMGIRTSRRSSEEALRLLREAEKLLTSTTTISTMT